MVQTRTRDHANSDKKALPAKKANGTKQSSKKPANAEQSQKHTAKKRSHSDEVPNRPTDDGSAASPEPKKAKKEQDEDTKPGKDKQDNTIKSKVDQVIAKYGTLPLSDAGLSEPTSPTPEPILALVLHAMLTSARISHELSYKSVRCCIEAGYHNLETLSKSSWQERTEVLTEGGYTRYREKTATALGELAELVREEYARRLLPFQNRDMIKGIKGIGNVGTDIFFDTAQGVWPSLAPFMDPRSLKTAEQCGLGSDVEQMWEAVEKDAVQMCKLASALTTIRLEKKEEEFR